MSVWLAIPSARPSGGTIPPWKARGYKVAACFDEAGGGGVDVDIRESIMPYPGYAMAVNRLVRLIFQQDPSVEWIVTGGDDVEPDMAHTPEEIARQCSEYFGGTFGVMQPTGDRFAGGSIDRIAGSPWMGAEFCRRMYGGCGPLFVGYQHMHVDEELFEVANRLGVYWPRRDLTHLHDHFMRKSRDVNSPAVHRETPPHLVRWNSQAHWNESKALFERRKSDGFPGHEPLPVEACA